MKNIIQLLIMMSLLGGCIANKPSLHVSGKLKDNSKFLSSSVSSVQIINHQLIIHGLSLNGVTGVKVAGNSFSEDFVIESKTDTLITANSSSSFSFDVSKVFNLLISNAEASSTFTIDFSLCNATLYGAGFDCSLHAANNDILSFDSALNKWIPRALSGLIYRGLYDVVANGMPAILPKGNYYIVSAPDSTYSIGDWLVSNGTTYDHLAMSTPTAAAANLYELLDVDLTTPPVSGKVLKYNGSKWVAADDLAGTAGAGSVTTTTIADGSVTDAKIAAVAASKITGTIASSQITDGTIVNADINAAAAIDYSKLSVPAGSIAYAKLSIADGDIPAAKITGLPSATAILATTITDGDTTHAPDGNVVFDTLATKLDKTGGTISTSLNVPTPVFGTEATTKTYVDNADALKANKAGDTFSGVLSLDSDLKIKGGSNYVTIKGSGTSAAYTLTLPANVGAANNVLTTNASGVLSWSAPSSVVSSLDAANISSGAVSNTEFNYLDGVTSSIQSQLDAKEGSLTAGTNLQYYRGDKTWSTLNTSAVPEGTNQYFTVARVLSSAIAGLTSTAGSVADGDSILTALGKLFRTQGDSVSKSGNTTVTGQITIDATTGTLVVPTPATLTQAANMGYVQSYVGGFGQWIKNASDISYTAGKVGIGTTSPGDLMTVSQANGSSGISVINTSSTTAQAPAISISNYAGSVGGAPILLLKNAKGSQASPAAMGAYETLGQILMQGAGSSSGVSNGVQIIAQTSEAWTGSSTGANLVFQVTSSGSTTPTEKLRINSDGRVGIGTGDPQAQLDVAGTIVSTPPAPFTGATVDLTKGNTQVLTNVGQSAITLNNMVHGGNYTLIIQDMASRIYTFTGCANSRYQPTNMATITNTHTMYSIVTVYNGTNFDCYISWSSGFN